MTKSCTWQWPDSLDAVVAAPASHRVVFENEHTRVLEVTIAASEREPGRTHRWPSVMVVHQPARIRYYIGETLTFTSPEQPMSSDFGPRVSWLTRHPVEFNGPHDPEGPHSVENIDDHAYGAFRIEFKPPWRCRLGAERARLVLRVSRTKLNLVDWIRQKLPESPACAGLYQPGPACSAGQGPT